MIDAALQTEWDIVLRDGSTLHGRARRAGRRALPCAAESADDTAASASRRSVRCVAQPI
jgi:hypothetical protein